MPGGSKYGGPVRWLELYTEVVGGNPDTEAKGAKNPYTSRNGPMFSFIDPEGVMALRRSDEDGAESSTATTVGR